MLLGFGLRLLAIVAGVFCQETGFHSDWPRWCGKVYRDGYPAFDPGGQTLPPKSVDGPPLLDLQFKPRYSLYLDNEAHGEFIVNAPLTQFFGKSWPGVKGCRQRLNFTISAVSDGTVTQPLVSSQVILNTTDSMFSFSLGPLTPSLSPISFILTASNNQTAEATLLYLPAKPDGSTTRIDNLNGGLHHSSPATNGIFQPFFPYGFFASYDGFLANVTATNTSLLDAYASAGLNAMCPLTYLSDSPIPLNYLSSALDIKILYDLRESYKNATFVRNQATLARELDSLFAYWSADEPDGWQDPFDAPIQAQKILHETDPYHPVAVVLNCQDYHFAEYSAGGDILMEDAYPIGINATFSKWNTVCNTTLGDCGCDNCKGSVFDVADRLDDLARYETWLNLWPKTKLHVPQSFHGEGYWGRDPTPEEEWAMVLLAVNHGAKGIVSWVYPASAELVAAHGRLAKVLTRAPVLNFVVEGRPESVDSGISAVDFAIWKGAGKLQGRMLVSIVNGGDEISDGMVVPVPGASGITDQAWGDVAWILDDEKLSVAKLPAMSTTLLLLELK